MNALRITEDVLRRALISTEDINARAFLDTESTRRTIVQVYGNLIFIFPWELDHRQSGLINLIERCRVEVGLVLYVMPLIYLPVDNRDKA